MIASVPVSPASLVNKAQVVAEAASVSYAKRKGEWNVTGTLSDFVEATAAKFGIPGVAVGVWADGQEIYACHGVTSVDNPLPVDRDTLLRCWARSRRPTRRPH